MSTAGWLVLIGFLAVIGGIWIFFTASRLDRLHARLDAAQSALDAQLVRRVAALRHAAESDPAALAAGARPSGPAGPVLSAAERIEIERLAQGALTAAGPDRQVAENEVGRAVTDIASRGIALLRAQRDELHESAVRVSIARRFYNDAVRDTRSLRGRRMPRLLHLAGRRELPQFFDIDDTVPPGVRHNMNKGHRRTVSRFGRFGAFGFAVLAVSAALTSCTETVTPPTPSPPAVSIAAPAPSTSASPSPTPPPAPVNPLTGLAPVPAGTVIGVKIDDTSNGRPQRGVDLADIVYIEQAEGGLSRLLAVFATNKPVVEPVRSVRASDPELLAPYGAMTLVASGGGGDALPTLYASPLHAVIDDRGDKGFVRDNRRSQPYNLTSDLTAVTANVATGAPVQSIGFTWSAAVPVGAPGTTLTTKVGSTTVAFAYDATSGRYVRSIGGVLQKAADGNPISTPNVIVQFCQITANSGDRDVNGSISQYTHSIGSGAVSVFRNGQRIDGTWSRATTGVGTTLTSAAGAPIALNPGGTWVVLVATGTALTSS